MTQPSTRRTQSLTRDLTVLRRYEIKVAYKDLRPGDVILIVRNGYGKEETVALRRSKRHSCTCSYCVEHQVCCLHIDHCAKLENARAKAEKIRAASIAAAQAERAEADRIAAEAKAYGEKLEAVKAAEMAQALAELKVAE